MKTHAENLRADRRVAEARQLLAEALREHSSSIDAVRPPDSQRRDGYADLLSRLKQSRGGAPYFPYLASGIGNGPWVELADGSVKLDFISGIGVHGWGHSSEHALQAGVDAVLEDVVMQGNLQQHPPSLKLMETLISWSRRGGASLEHCFLSTSGAMANENALKIAYHARPGADRLLAFDGCFAGRTLALAAVTDRAPYRAGLPATLQVDYLPFFDGRDPEGSIQRASERFDELVARYPSRHAAFWAEIVAGEGGYYPANREFLVALCERARAAGMAIIFDEIQTFSRLGRPFAFQQLGLDPFADLVTVGKITQVCATLYGSRYQPSAPILSQTFTGPSVGIAAGQAMLAHLEASNCFGDAGWNQQRHDYFVQRLAELAERYPRRLQGPFGAGMMIAFTPGDGSLETARRVVQELYDEGLISFFCGGNPYRIRFLPPPLCTTVEHIDIALGILERVVGRMAEGA